ncbi:ALP1-like protein [Tanacetum coccineum]
MAIAEDEPTMGNTDARPSQWVEITMKKVQRLLFMNDGDGRKHVLDYKNVDLHYVEDQSKNLLSKFNSLKQEFKVNLDQLLTEQVPGNIICALAGRGKRKEIISSKEVLFMKGEISPSNTTPDVTFVTESECDNQEPPPPLPKLLGAEPLFQEGCDVVGKANISALVKCTSAIRQLAYAAVPDSLDEYLQIGEKTSRDCLMHFCNGVIELYGEEYLRRPTQTDVEKLYAFHENKHGFPGMIGSIDCTKWSWAQCPQAYRAQFSRGDSGSEPFILLEAVASQDLWIWHAFFGVAGSNNDVNVLWQSLVLNNLKVGKAPEVPFMANNVTYKWGYYLTDGIYPEWAVLMKFISQPGSNDVKRIRYKQAHEATRKDVERAFDVLKKK